MIVTTKPPIERTSYSMADVVLFSAKKNGYTYGQPASFVFDVSNLRDPGAKADIRSTATDGRSTKSREYFRGDPRVLSIMDEVHRLAIEGVRVNKASWVDFRFEDATGLWISPALAEEVADYLGALAMPFKVFVDHLELKRKEKH